MPYPEIVWRLVFDDDMTPKNIKLIYSKSPVVAMLLKTLVILIRLFYKLLFGVESTMETPLHSLKGQVFVKMVMGYKKPALVLKTDYQ